jgi:hypothetical protein
MIRGKVRVTEQGDHVISNIHQPLLHHFRAGQPMRAVAAPGVGTGNCGLITRISCRQWSVAMNCGICVEVQFGPRPNLLTQYRKMN